jgi:hypothetical protein
MERGMTQVLSVSATTAAYAMDAAKPARRVATVDRVKDARVEAERNETRRAGTESDAAAGLIPAVTLALDLTAGGLGGQQQRHTSLRHAESAYKEI